MNIPHGALLKTTLLDFPGEVAAVIFLPYCNLRCPYCHNSALVKGEEEELLSISELRSFLQKRAPLLGGVVISGGEPLLYDDLPALINYIHLLGLKVKIDTNGLFPEKLKTLKVDYIAMDIKSSLSAYGKLGLKDEADGELKLKQSIEYILSSGIDHEFRTTVTEEIFSTDDIDLLSPLLKGAQNWFLTPFRPGETLDPLYREKEPPLKDYMEELLERILSHGIEAMLR